MADVYFPSMEAADVAESDNADSGPLPTLKDADEQLPSGGYFANSFGNSNEEWDSILREFTTDSCIQDSSTFNTSLISTSPVTSVSFRNTPDTIVSNACVTAGAPRECADDMLEPDFGANDGDESQQQEETASCCSAPSGNRSHRSMTGSATQFATAAKQATQMGSGAILCSAATLGASPTEPTLVMNASPRHRVSRLPPDIGVDGHLRYLEPHEIPNPKAEVLRGVVQRSSENKLVLPPELEKHMYYPPGQQPSQQQNQTAPHVRTQQSEQSQQTQHQQSQQMQNQKSQQMHNHQSQQIQSQHVQSQQMQNQQSQQIQSQQVQSQNMQPQPQSLQSRNIQGSQQFQYFQQSQQDLSSHAFMNQQCFSQIPHFAQNIHHSQPGYPSLHQPNVANQLQAQNQHYFPYLQQFPNAPQVQQGSHASLSTSQLPQQFMLPGHGNGRIHAQSLLAAQNQGMELYYTADGYQSYSSRTDKPPNINSHDWLRNRDFRSTWNLGDIYTNWLDTSPNTVEPHVKPFLKKDIKLGMSSQDATKAAITDGFVRGAAWAAKLFLTQMEKEMRESGTMLGYRPHKKVQKAELEQSVIDHVVRTNTPSIHGAQCANVIAWAYDEFYPGVFRQEGNNGKPRGPKEIFESWKSLSETVVPDQLKPVLFDTSTGMTVMTNIQPSRPPVAQVRAFATQMGPEPAIRISQFPVPDSRNEHISMQSGENFFTKPEGPTTMKFQQIKRIESMAPRSVAKPQGARQPPKTAEEKKENRNRKADEKIRWTLTGQSRTIQHEHMTAVSYQCSDGEFRILEGQRLEEAKERTLRRSQKQQAEKSIAEAAGVTVPSTATNESATTISTATAAGARSNGQTTPLSIVGAQKIQEADQMDSRKGQQRTTTGAVKRKRMPDEESMPACRRKRERPGTQHGLRSSIIGAEVLIEQPLGIYIDE